MNTATFPKNKFVIAKQEGEVKKYLMYDYDKDNASYRSLDELFSGNPTFLCVFDSGEEVMLFLQRHPHHIPEHPFIASVHIAPNESAIHFGCMPVPGLTLSR